jgi:hypothetical protein
MGSPKPREQRQVVYVTCRVRHESGWSDMTICNLSSRGLMAKCDAALPRGAFVEVRRGPVTIVGQVRWSDNRQFGILTQERIDIGTLLGGDGTGGSATGTERRARARAEVVAKPRASAADLEQRSRQRARLFDWAVLAVAGIVAAGLLVTQVYATLDAPMAQVRTAMTR